MDARTVLRGPPATRLAPPMLVAPSHVRGLARRLLRKKAYRFTWRRLRTRSVNEPDLQNVLDQVVKDVASATGTIREEVALHGDSSLVILPFRVGSDPRHRPERLSRRTR